MDIRSALAGLVALEKSLTITSPISATIKRAYTYTPNRASALPDTPAWINSWSMLPVDEIMGPGPPLQHYAVNSQLMIFDADNDRAADIATAFHVALVAAWHADTTLGGVVSYADLRGGTPTLALLEWVGLSYIGLDLTFDLALDN